jgi:hypothetical protein
LQPANRTKIKGSVRAKQGLLKAWPPVFDQTPFRVRLSSNDQEMSMSRLKAYLNNTTAIHMDSNCVVSLLFSLLGLVFSLILLMLNPDALVALIS